MNELLSNLEKVHTTEMGEARIKKNLNIDCADIVAYCVEKIKKENCPGVSRAIFLCSVQVVKLDHLVKSLLSLGI